MAAMTSRASDQVPPGLYVPTADARIVMQRIDWAGYQSLLALRGDERCRPRLAYLDGTVELMSPSNDHEFIRSRIGQIIELYCIFRGVPLNSYGNWTLRDYSGEAGAEPDECFVFRPHADAGQRPDLAIEVIWTRGGIDKLEIYRRLGVREVWFWDAESIAVHVLGDAGYEIQERSVWLPDLDPALVCRLARLATVNDVATELRVALDG
jgi:Uma2 family endonuclease